MLVKKLNNKKNNTQNNIILLFSARFLKAKNRKLPNLGVSMSMFAIAISIAILIIVTSVMNGFRDELLDKILGFNAHISIYKHEEFKDYIDIQNETLKLKGVVNATPTINGAGMLIGSNGANKQSAGTFVKGISQIDLLKREQLAKFVKGDLTRFYGFQVVLGYDLARQIGAKINDRITLVVPIVAPTMFGMIPRSVQLKVVGVIKTNAQQYDNYTLLMPFDTAQKVFNRSGVADNLEIITTNANEIDKVEDEIITKLSKKNLWLSDWRMENRALLNALNVEANVMALLLSLFTIISMFTIFAVIRMMIKSKEREIAILKSHGISNNQINHIFLIIGITMAITGMVLGNLIGITLSTNIDNIRLFLEKLFGTQLLDGSVYFLSNLPSKLMLGDIIKINIFAFIMAILCSFLSIRKNTKIDVVSILRNN